MDTIETPRTGVIRAKFNYIVDTGTPPVRYIDWPEMAHKAIDPVYEQRDMPVHDGRPLRATFDLDTHGFVLADHVTQVKDFTSEAERKNVYDAEVQALIQQGKKSISHHLFPERRAAMAFTERKLFLVN